MGRDLSLHRLDSEASHAGLLETGLAALLAAWTLAQLGTNRRLKRNSHLWPDFIAKRSATRWAMHQLIFWGCLLAVAITFPLVFGWINFTSAPTIR